MIIKTEAQIAHKARNAAAKAQAAQRKEDRVNAHEQRNAEAAYEAAARRMDAKAQATKTTTAPVQVANDDDVADMAIAA